MSGTTRTISFLVISTLLFVTSTTIADDDSVDNNEIEDLDVTPKLFPYLANLNYKNVTICSAAVVSQEHVLTAAHCTKGSAKALAIQTLSEGPNSHYGVKSVKVHPEYNLAVVRVKSPFNLSVEPIPLYEPTSPLLEQTFSVVVGVDLKKDDTSNQHYVFAMTTDHDTCASKLKGQNVRSDGAVCVGSFEFQGASVCPSKAGSLLTIDGHLAGIAAFRSCDSEQTTGVFTRTSEVYQWVQDNTRVY